MNVPSDNSIPGNPTRGEVGLRVFVGGCPRSGTTLLQRMLDHHPLLAVANDTHFIPRALQKASRKLYVQAVAGESIPLSQELRESVWNYHRFYRLGILRSEFERASREATTYNELVIRLFAVFAQHHNKPFSGEKTPDYVKHIDLLLNSFPAARFVHIVRDGRNTALSLQNWATTTKGPGRLEWWRHDPVAVAALWWRQFVQSGSTQKSSGRVLTLRYEDLLADAEGILRELCLGIELPYDDCMLRFHEGKESQRKSGSAKSQWLPVTSGLRNWRQSMDSEDVAVFELLAGETLTLHGYELSDVEKSAKARERASRAMGVVETIKASDEESQAIGSGSTTRAVVRFVRTPRDFRTDPDAAGHCRRGGSCLCALQTTAKLLGRLPSQSG